MNNNNKIAGIIGGLGPFATVYFLDMITKLTKATCDQEHVDMIITNIASTPDRTSFLLKSNKQDPRPSLINAAKKLESSCANFIVMTCNTAHNFYNEIQKEINIPFFNIIEETVKYAKEHNFKKVCILATKGTLDGQLYQDMCRKYDLDFLVPSQTQQDTIMSFIYDYIKKGIKVPIADFNNFISTEFNNQCDGFILGCTELSLLKQDYNLDSTTFIDSLEVLARKTILESDKEVIA